MGKSTPKSPTPPDPVATANAQANANKETAVAQANLNRIDQYTPQGSLTYQQIGTNADGTPRYQQTTQYSPEQQALYNQQNQIAQALGGLAQQNISRVSQAQSTPFNYDGMTPLQSGVQGGNIQTSFNQGGPLTSNVQGGNVQSQIASGGNVQTGLNYGQAFNPGDFNQAATNASNSAYQAAAARLDPQYKQMQSDLNSSLAAQGISENSDAYRRAQDNLARQRTDAYGQAQNNAFAQGLAAQQQGYGQALGTRQQNTNEITQQGQFANQAQGQIFGQNAAQLQANNDAQNQLFQQGQQNAQLNNQAQGQQFSQNQSAADFNNQAQNQQYNQNLSSAQFNNNARQQQIQEAAYLRNLPLNDIAALLGTGGGVQNPNFNQFAQVGVAAPDYQGAVYNSYNAQNQQYQQQMAQRSAGLGGLFGLAGSLAGAFSDRRVKRDIKRIGTLANGLPTYAFKYIWDNVQRFGVMAQDVLKVRPDAVSDVNGIMYVDYGKVW